MTSEIMIFIARRISWMILLFLLASFLSFSLLYFAPGNAAQLILTAELAHEPTKDAVQQFINGHGLHQPFIAQYTGWVGNIIHGDFGTSLKTGDPVLEEFKARFPATLLLALSAFVFMLVVGIPLGVLSAVKPNSGWDYLGNAVASIGIAIPSFWFALLLIFFFALQLDLLPSFGYGGIEHLILPTVALGIHPVAKISRITRESLLDVLGKEYITAAYAKGIEVKRIIFRHALRNAMIPVVTIAGLDLGYFLGGTVIIEEIFGWPGIGRFLLNSVLARDFPVVAGFILVIVFFFLLINLIVDIAYSIIDPRVQLGGEPDGR